MSEENLKRVKKITARLNQKEWQEIDRQFAKSAYRKLSIFVRKKLLDKPVTVFQRNRSMDEFMAEMMLLRKELNAIGNNYNQVVKRLHIMYDLTEVKTWLKIHESSWQMMQKKVNEIKSKIDQINEQWLR